MIAGRWYVSSGVDIDAAATFPSEDADLYGLVTHEHPGDEGFWDLVREGAHDRRWKLGLDVEVRVVGSPDVSEQAALVGECVADGAAGIGATLADPEGMRAALQAAADAGVIVHTFNSGLEHFESVGATRHISIDELNAGEVAAELFIEAGVSGRVLCVIHEESNVGAGGALRRLRGCLRRSGGAPARARERGRRSRRHASGDRRAAALGFRGRRRDHAQFAARQHQRHSLAEKRSSASRPRKFWARMSILLRPRITDQQDAHAWIDVQRHLRSEFSGDASSVRGDNRR